MPSKENISMGANLNNSINFCSASIRSEQYIYFQMSGGKSNIWQLHTLQCYCCIWHTFLSVIDFKIVGLAKMIAGKIRLRSPSAVVFSSVNGEKEKEKAHFTSIGEYIWQVKMKGGIHCCRKQNVCDGLALLNYASQNKEKLIICPRL